MIDYRHAGYRKPAAGQRGINEDIPVSMLRGGSADPGCGPEWRDSACRSGGGGRFDTVLVSANSEVRPAPRGGIAGPLAPRLPDRRLPVHEAGAAPFAEPIPVADWGRFEQLRLKTSDGLEIGAWLATGSSDRPSVLLVHGIGASRAACLGR